MLDQPAKDRSAKSREYVMSERPLFDRWKMEQRLHEDFVEREDATPGARLAYVIELASCVEKPPREHRQQGHELPRKVFVARLIEAMQHLQRCEWEHLLIGLEPNEGSFM